MSIFSFGFLQEIDQWTLIGHIRETGQTDDLEMAIECLLKLSTLSPPLLCSFCQGIHRYHNFADSNSFHSFRSQMENLIVQGFVYNQLNNRNRIAFVLMRQTFSSNSTSLYCLYLFYSAKNMHYVT